MKKLLALALATLTLFLFTACGVQQIGGDESTDDPGNTYTGDIVFEDRNETVYATTTVNIRTSPSSASDDNRDGQLTKGEPVTRTGYNEDWSRVEIDGKVRYISSTYLSLTKPSDDDNSGNGGNNSSGASSDLVDISKFKEINDTITLRDIDDNKDGISVRSTPDRYDSDNHVLQAKIGETYKRTGYYLDGKNIDGIPTGWNRIEYTDDNGETKVGYTRSWHWTSPDPEASTDTDNTATTTE